MKLTNYLVQQDLHDFLFTEGTTIEMDIDALTITRKTPEAEFGYSYEDMESLNYDFSVVDELMDHANSMRFMEKEWENKKRV